jgi:outer membrane protein assembly factor BamB
MPKWTWTLTVTVLTAGSWAIAADWPQYRGPKHDGSTAETDIAARWPKGEPKVLWKKPMGNAFGSFAVAGDKAYLFMERDGKEVTVALNPDTGDELWATPIDKTIFEKQGGNGPRTTPTIDGERVYVFGTYFKLSCLNAADGKVVWQKNLAAEHTAQTIDNRTIKSWGNAMSPLIVGELVIVSGGGAGQTFLAFNKSDGKLAWKTGDEKVTHATPTLAKLHGEEQVIFFVQSGLVSLRPADGKELWRFAHPFKTATASSPIVGGKAGDVVYCSAGYGVGAAACRVSRDGDRFTATPLWADGEYMNHWTTPVHAGGYLYGIFGHNQRGTAPLKCVDIETGKETWSKDGFGSGGGTILVDGHVLVQGDKGELTLVEAKPDAYKQVGRFQVLGGKCWTMAIYVNGRIYARSDKEGACIQLDPALAARTVTEIRSRSL